MVNKMSQTLFDHPTVEGRLGAQDQVVFLHTDGAPNLFTQAETLAAGLDALDGKQTLLEGNTTQ
jgi:hypothetical protein